MGETTIPACLKTYIYTEMMYSDDKFLKTYNVNGNLEDMMCINDINLKNDHIYSEADVILLSNSKINNSCDIDNDVIHIDINNLYQYMNYDNKDYKLEIIEEEVDKNKMDNKSANLVSPVMYIANSILLPIIISLFSAYVYDLLKRKECNSNTVELKVIVQYKKDKYKSKVLEYTGPIEGLKSNFEKIDINKF